MKDFLLKVVLGILVGLLVSCGTATGTYKPIALNENVIGSVQASFEAMHGDRLTNENKRAIDEAAYVALLQAAQTEYQGNIDIRDITWSQGRFISNVRTAMSLYEFSASGKVVSLSASADAAGVEGALARAAEQTLRNVPKQSMIAIVYITAADRSTTDFIAGELEYIWVNDGYRLTDRSQLDRLRQEQNFQMSGEVDDETAVSIGKFAGADIIVTGTVDGEGNLRRLRLRALNTETAQVVGVASERL